MTKDKALDLALEALEHMLEDAKQERLTVEYWNECVDAITAIKQARSAPVQEPFGYVWFTKHMEHRFTRMKPHPDIGAMNIKPVYTAPPGQEPVAYTTGHCKEKAQPGGCQLHNLHCGYPACDRKAVTTPPAAQRQWVGLTDEAIWSEYQTLWPFHPAEEPGLAKDIAKFARAIEAKLKEKNT